MTLIPLKCEENNCYYMSKVFVCGEFLNKLSLSLRKSVLLCFQQKCGKVQ